MKRAQTMFGRVAVVVFAGLALAHALTFAVLLHERGLLARDMMASYLGSEVASALAILDRVPPRSARHGCRGWRAGTTTMRSPRCRPPRPRAMRCR